MIGAYFGDIERRLADFPLTVSVGLDTEHVDTGRGYVRARVTFSDGSELHLFEYVVFEDEELRHENYRYHYQTADGNLVKRWDDAPHHPDVATSPDHVHVGDEVAPSERPTLEETLAKVAKRIRG
jgi:hypothetical protein